MPTVVKDIYLKYLSKNDWPATPKQVGQIIGIRERKSNAPASVPEQKSKPSKKL
jgi:hypothetical protein